MIKLTLKQYPAHRSINPELLSTEQLTIRIDATNTELGETKICKKCLNKLPINEFWFNDKKANRRRNTCKDCMSEEQGVVEIGRVRFARKLFDKGFRRCTTCKDIKPLDKFSKDHTHKYAKGYNFVCQECVSKAIKKRYQAKCKI